jgi:RNA polymerase sigma-70 factor (ECF subfamily)
MQNILSATNATVMIKSWVNQYSDSMYSWAFHKTSSKETAEDLVQEAFLAAFQAFDSFKGDSIPKTWLFSILNNKINDYYRSNYRKPIVTGEAIFEKLFDENDKWKAGERPQQWSEDTGNLLDNDEFRNIWQYCMGKLPGNWFSAIQLKFIEEKNGELICQELGITDTNFWQILHRAKLQLRKCIELNWFKK